MNPLLLYVLGKKCYNRREEVGTIEVFVNVQSSEWSKII